MVQGGEGETKVKGEAMAKDPRLCMDQGTKEAMVKYQGPKEATVKYQGPREAMVKYQGPKEAMVKYQGPKTKAKGGYGQG